jgi:hypothetical protein
VLGLSSWVSGVGAGKRFFCSQASAFNFKDAAGYWLLASGC